MSDAKSNWEPEREERRAPRYSVCEAESACEVKLGSQVYPARLLNKSVGGFALLVACPKRPAVAQLASLRTDDKWLPIRIVHVTQVVHSNDAHLLGDSSPCYRVGCACAHRSLLGWFSR
ncbi:MAG: hypothetical protein ABFC63_08560 [Thermoguttaceae bacterium]